MRQWVHSVDGVLHDIRLHAADEWRRDLRQLDEYVHDCVQRQLHEMRIPVHLGRAMLYQCGLYASNGRNSDLQ